MSDKNDMAYCITEDQFDHLYSARRLLSTLEDLATTGTSEPRVDMNRESLATTLSTIGEMMDKTIPDLCPHRINIHAISEETTEN